MLNKILTSDLLKNKKVILKIMLLDTPFEVDEIIDIRQEIIDKFVYICKLENVDLIQISNNILLVLFDNPRIAIDDIGKLYIAYDIIYFGKLCHKIDIFTCQIIQNNIIIGKEYKYLVKHRSSIKKISLYRFMAHLYKEFRCHWIYI